MSGTELDDRWADSVGDRQVVSDDALRRILLATGGLGALAVVIALFAAGVLWATADDSGDDFGSADIGFLQDMIDHHLQAVEISNAYLSGNRDGDAAPYATEVVLFQERDIGRMDEWLRSAGFERGSSTRSAMTWMGMSTPVAAMPGMATQARVDQLAAARGPAADRLFFELMTEHHLGGAAMADAAVAQAKNDTVVSFAESVSRNQRVEVVEYERAIERLGL